MRTPLKALVAAGNKLKVDPETFEVQLGPIKGRALNMQVVEDISQAPQRVVSSEGQVSYVSPRARYETQVTIVWDLDSVEKTVGKSKNLKAELADFMNRLRTKMDYGNLEDPDTRFEMRD